MKIYINRKPVSGPWGGGSKVLKAIINALENSGHKITFSLSTKCDVLFCFDPRPDLANGMLGYDQMLEYSTTENCWIIQRVGDVGTHGKPDLANAVLKSIPYSDAVIFTSQWAMDSVVQKLGNVDAILKNRFFVVSNGPMKVFFDSKKRDNHVSISSKKPRLITHHWSTNPKKGFSFYEQLDAAAKSLFEVEFTYVGRLPPNLKLTNHVNPLSEIEMAHELVKHDIYVTASLEEAGANHVLEAMAAQLPVIYHQDGGSIVESCQKYGLAFDGSLSGFEKALKQIIKDYSKFKSLLKNYEYTVEDAAQQYVKIIEDTCI